jgi:hypothetical protein
MTPADWDINLLWSGRPTRSSHVDWSPCLPQSGVAPEDGDQSTHVERDTHSGNTIRSGHVDQGGLLQGTSPEHVASSRATLRPPSLRKAQGYGPLGVCLRTPSLRMWPYMVAYERGLRTGMGSDAGHSGVCGWRMPGFFQHVAVGDGVAMMAEDTPLAVYCKCSSASAGVSPISVRGSRSRSRLARLARRRRRWLRLRRWHRALTRRPTPNFFVCTFTLGVHHPVAGKAALLVTALLAGVVGAIVLDRSGR